MQSARSARTPRVPEEEAHSLPDIDLIPISTNDLLHSLRRDVAEEVKVLQGYEAERLNHYLRPSGSSKTELQAIPRPVPEGEDLIRANTASLKRFGDVPRPALPLVWGDLLTQQNLSAATPLVSVPADLVGVLWDYGMRAAREAFHMWRLCLLRYNRCHTKDVMASSQAILERMLVTHEQGWQSKRELLARLKAVAKEGNIKLSEAYIPLASLPTPGPDSLPPGLVEPVFEVANSSDAFVTVDDCLGVAKTMAVPLTVVDETMPRLQWLGESKRGLILRLAVDASMQSVSVPTVVCEQADADRMLSGLLPLCGSDASSVNATDSESVVLLQRRFKDEVSQVMQSLQVALTGEVNTQAPLLLVEPASLDGTILCPAATPHPPSPQTVNVEASETRVRDGPDTVAPSTSLLTGGGTDQVFGSVQATVRTTLAASTPDVAPGQFVLKLLRQMSGEHAALVKMGGQACHVASSSLDALYELRHLAILHLRREILFLSNQCSAVVQSLASDLYSGHATDMPAVFLPAFDPKAFIESQTDTASFYTVDPHGLDVLSAAGERVLLQSALDGLEDMDARHLVLASRVVAATPKDSPTVSRPALLVSILRLEVALHRAKKSLLLDLQCGLLNCVDVLQSRSLLILARRVAALQVEFGPDSDPLPYATANVRAIEGYAKTLHCLMTAAQAEVGTDIEGHPMDVGGGISMGMTDINPALAQAAMTLSTLFDVSDAVAHAFPSLSPQCIASGVGTAAHMEVLYVTQRRRDAGPLSDLPAPLRLAGQFGYISPDTVEATFEVALKEALERAEEVDTNFSTDVINSETVAGPSAAFLTPKRLLEAIPSPPSGTEARLTACVGASSLRQWSGWPQTEWPIPMQVCQNILNVVYAKRRLWSATLESAVLGQIYGAQCELLGLSARLALGDMEWEALEGRAEEEVLRESKREQADIGVQTAFDRSKGVSLEPEAVSFFAHAVDEITPTDLQGFVSLISLRRQVDLSASTVRSFGFDDAYDAPTYSLCAGPALVQRVAQAQLTFCSLLVACTRLSQPALDQVRRTQLTAEAEVIQSLGEATLMSRARDAVQKGDTFVTRRVALDDSDLHTSGMKVVTEQDPLLRLDRVTYLEALYSVVWQDLLYIVPVAQAGREMQGSVINPMTVRSAARKRLSQHHKRRADAVRDAVALSQDGTDAKAAVLSLRHAMISPYLSLISNAIRSIAVCAQIAGVAATCVSTLKSVDTGSVPYYVNEADAQEPTFAEDCTIGSFFAIPDPRFCADLLPTKDITLPVPTALVATLYALICHSDILSVLALMQTLEGGDVGSQVELIAQAVHTVVQEADKEERASQALKYLAKRRDTLVLSVLPCLLTCLRQSAHAEAEAEYNHCASIIARYCRSFQIPLGVSYYSFDGMHNVNLIAQSMGDSAGGDQAPKLECPATPSFALSSGPFLMSPTLPLPSRPMSGKAVSTLYKAVVDMAVGTEREGGASVGVPTRGAGHALNVRGSLPRAQLPRCAQAVGAVDCYTSWSLLCHPGYLTQSRVVSQLSGAEAESGGEGSLWRGMGLAGTSDVYCPLASVVSAVKAIQSQSLKLAIVSQSLRLELELEAELSLVSEDLTPSQRETEALRTVASLVSSSRVCNLFSYISLHRTHSMFSPGTMSSYSTAEDAFNDQVLRSLLIDIAQEGKHNTPESLLVEIQADQRVVDTAVSKYLRHLRLTSDQTLTIQREHALRERVVAEGLQRIEAECLRCFKAAIQELKVAIEDNRTETIPTQEHPTLPWVPFYAHTTLTKFNLSRIDDSHHVRSLQRDLLGRAETVHDSSGTVYMIPADSLVKALDAHAENLIEWQTQLMGTVQRRATMMVSTLKREAAEAHALADARQKRLEAVTAEVGRRVDSLAALSGFSQVTASTRLRYLATGLASDLETLEADLRAKIHGEYSERLQTLAGRLLAVEDRAIDYREEHGQAVRSTLHEARKDALNKLADKQQLESVKSALRRFVTLDDEAMQLRTALETQCRLTRKARVFGQMRISSLQSRLGEQVESLTSQMERKTAMLRQVRAQQMASEDILRNQLSQTQEALSKSEVETAALRQKLSKFGRQRDNLLQWKGRKSRVLTNVSQHLGDLNASAQLDSARMLEALHKSRSEGTQLRRALDQQERIADLEQHKLSQRIAELTSALQQERRVKRDAVARAEETAARLAALQQSGTAVKGVQGQSIRRAVLSETEGLRRELYSAQRTVRRLKSAKPRGVSARPSSAYHPMDEEERPQTSLGLRPVARTNLPFLQ
ncbi:hypothetical protein KIPB_005915 [Kipferlia bialata]|uniref:Uncharacterized protein n=1 Tax=Kipferlia bialata TaxID=797122 RepID=A0A9K3CV40_9EUKA|nr:hypothetical protein KIPB_003245 [Kipferlia bialata]GIQ83031.1 hypothetical protein KIPB_004277 [Kipferlia bialata]GIQ84428.1 hypothetical protein KIPB_005915 [Kipferlia bialata]|eukprot:g3245.t1